MTKIYYSIFFLSAFLIYKLYTLDSKIKSSGKNKSIQRVSRISVTSTKPAPILYTSATTIITETNAASTDLTEEEPERTQDFDSLNELRPHVEFTPAEDMAVPVEKLTPEELEQFQVGEQLRQMVNTTGEKQTPVQKKGSENEPEQP